MHVQRLTVEISRANRSHVCDIERCLEIVGLRHAIFHQNIAGHFQNIGKAFVLLPLLKISRQSRQLMRDVHAAITHIIKIDVDRAVQRFHNLVRADGLQGPSSVYIQIKSSCSAQLIEPGDAIRLGHRQ